LTSGPNIVFDDAGKVVRCRASGLVTVGFVVVVVVMRMLMALGSALTERIG
jgi:hypothetical protein